MRLRFGLPDGLPHHQRLRMAFWASVTMVCALTGWYVCSAWRETREGYDASLARLSMIVAASTQHSLEDSGAILKLSAIQLLQQGGLANPRMAWLLLAGYKATYSHRIASINIIAPNGKILVSTAFAPGQPLPNLQNHPQLGPVLREAMRHQGVTISRPMRDPLGSQWVIPQTFAVFQSSRKPLYIATSFVYLRGIEDQWREWSLPKGIHVGLLRNDGYLEGRWPISTDRLGDILAKPYGSALAETLGKYGGLRHGFYEGFETVDRAVRMGAFTRLNGYPLAAFADISRGRVVTAWCRRIRFPVAFMALAIGFLWLGYRWILAQYRRGEWQRKAVERSLKEWATHDALTGLPNREGLRLLFEQAIARADRQELLLAVCFLDLDDFKPINDTHGHATGDILLRDLARRMRAILRKSDTLARLGGDEFVFLLEGLHGLEDLERALAHIHEVFERPFVVNNHALFLKVSAGVTLYPFDDADADGLLRHADGAMYAAKARPDPKGDGWWQLYEAGGRTMAVSAQHDDFRGSLAAGAVTMFYQPIVSIDTGRVAGVEALTRWQREGREVSPSVFLPTLGVREREALGRFVLENGLRQLAQWQATGLDLFLSVNITPEELENPGFADTVFEALAAQPDVSPHSLVLEVLESGEFFDHETVLRQLQRLRAAGIKIALDDVGSAYASLLRVKNLPIDEIKIDQGFVRSLLDKPQDLVFIKSLVALGLKMDMQITVEGVEKAGHIAFLRETAAHYLQGYAIARPLEARAVPDFVRGFVLGPGDPDTPLLALHRHQEWMHMVEEAALSPSLCEEMDQEQCPITSWLRAHAAALPNIESLSSEHEAVHDLGRELLAARDGLDQPELRGLLSRLYAHSRVFQEELGKAMGAVQEQV